MKKKLACGCEVDPEELKKLPMIICPNCGKEHPATPYCGYCGFKLGSEHPVKKRD